MDTNSNQSAALYPPSWIDRLILWVEQLRGPYWIFYLLATFVIVLVINGGLWIEGSLPVGSLDPENSGFGFLVFYYLFLYHYLTHTASKALHSFRPLLDASDDEFSKIEQGLTQLPRWIGRLILLFGFGIGVLSVINDPMYTERVEPLLWLIMLDSIITSFLTVTFFAMITRSIRQLLLVNRLQKSATNLNLMNLAPAHAFSSLTARTGIGVIFAGVSTYVLEFLTFGSIINPTIYLSFSALALAAFVLPVIGIKNRIEDEKEGALERIAVLLQQNFDRLHTIKNDTELQDLEKVKTMADALISERDLLSKVSTWPWNPATLRSFASALLLPIFLWVVTRLLENIF
jgi:hypothetical protein